MSVARVPNETLANALGADRVAAVYCLGLCACGPNATTDGKPVVRATPARLLGSNGFSVNMDRPGA